MPRFGDEPAIGAKTASYYKRCFVDPFMWSTSLPNNKAERHISTIWLLRVGNAILRRARIYPGIDPQTGVLVRLFHPRQDRWTEHFELEEKRTLLERIAIVGLTPVGRATVRLLDMNEELRQALRYELLH